MKTSIIYLLALFALYFASKANAADYYWTTANGQYQGSSYTAACTAALAGSRYDVMDAPQLASVGRDVYYCMGHYKANPNSLESYNTVYRKGDSCPKGSELDAETGSCNPTEPEDPCAAKAGQSTPFSKSGSGPDGYMSIFDAAGGKKSAPAQSGCFNGCAASTAQQKCTVKVAGSYFCRGTAYYTGSACGTSTDAQSLDSSDTSAFPDAQTISDKKPCVYSTGPDGSQTCTSETSTEKEGQTCGTYNGATICADKKPNSDKMKIDTNVSQTSNPDGSKVVTKVDVSTKTVCEGVQTCVVTTTTTTTRITKDKDGNTTSTTTKTDTTTGKGGKNDGKGSSAGEGGGSGGDEEGGAVKTPEMEDAKEYGDVNQAYYKRIADAPLMKAVSGIKFPDGGGSCSIPSASVAIIGTISFSTFCSQAADWLAPIRGVMLAIFAFLSLRHLMSA